MLFYFILFTFKQYHVYKWECCNKIVVVVVDLALHHGLNVNLDVPTPLHMSSNVSPELFELHQVTESQVEKVIRGLPSNKAPGVDKISSRILKDCLPCTLSTITRIVNNSFFTNTFARAWKTAEITPILKCGNPDVLSNYRPISLLPIVSKITERLVHGQLMEYLIKNNKLAVHQSGKQKASLDRNCSVVRYGSVTPGYG